MIKLLEEEMRSKVTIIMITVNIMTMVNMVIIDILIMMMIILNIKMMTRMNDQTNWKGGNVGGNKCKDQA